jgi:hypothetical protein
LSKVFSSLVTSDWALVKKESRWNNNLQNFLRDSVLG